MSGTSESRGHLARPGTGVSKLSAGTRQQTFRDGADRQIAVSVGRETVLRRFEDPLRDMYGTFGASDRSMGLPPRSDSAIADWLDALDRPDIHHAVASQDGMAVGHAMIVPDEDGDHEFAIYVREGYRGAGVGSALRDAVLDSASRAGVESVWLVADRQNLAVIELCRDRFERTETTSLSIHMRCRLG